MKFSFAGNFAYFLKKKNINRGIKKYFKKSKADDLEWCNSQQTVIMFLKKPATMGDDSFVNKTMQKKTIKKMLNT